MTEQEKQFRVAGQSKGSDFETGRCWSMAMGCWIEMRRTNRYTLICD
jgi:hypothetical protein